MLTAGGGVEEFGGMGAHAPASAVYLFPVPGLGLCEPWVSFKLSSVFPAPRSGALLPFLIATRVPKEILYDNYMI